MLEQAVQLGMPLRASLLSACKLKPVQCNAVQVVTAPTTKPYMISSMELSSLWKAVHSLH